jgi:predicted DNA-binding transcriptional regulator AlpA
MTLTPTENRTMNYVTTADMAEALGLEREYVTDRLTKRPDFPAPALVLSRKTVRWLRTDFEEWCRAQTSRAALQSPQPSRGSKTSSARSGRGAR